MLRMRPGWVDAAVVPLLDRLGAASRPDDDLLDVGAVAGRRGHSSVSTKAADAFFVGVEQIRLLLAVVEHLLIARAVGAKDGAAWLAG